MASSAEEAAEQAVPKPTAQRNFTDPDSRIMKTSDRSFHQCYNAQAIVDERHQTIVASALDNQAADCPALPGMLGQLQANLGAVFGQMDTDQNAGQVRLRGLDNAAGERRLHALVHNIPRIFTAQVTIAPA